MFGLLKSVLPEAHHIDVSLRFHHRNIQTTLWWMTALLTVAQLSRTLEVSAVQEPLAFHTQKIINNPIPTLALRFAHSRLAISFNTLSSVYPLIERQ